MVSETSFKLRGDKQVPTNRVWAGRSKAWRNKKEDCNKK